jgi:hypothetical protein
MPRRAEQAPLCIDDIGGMTQEQVDEIICRAVMTGERITIDITPMVERRIHADKVAAPRKR